MKKNFNLLKCLKDARHEETIVWLCNIGAEKFWNKMSKGFVDPYEEGIVNRMEEVNLLVCREQDIMILREYPDKDYLEILKSFGFSIPTILVPENSDELTSISELVLRDKNLQDKIRDISESKEKAYFMPFAVTYLEEQIAKNCSLEIVGSSASINALVNDKINNRCLAEKLGFRVCEGKACSSIDEVREEYRRLKEEPCCFDKVIIKEPHGASGKCSYIIENEKKLEPVLKMIDKLSRYKSQRSWVVEGWYDKKTDVNYQLYISDDGDVDVFSISQQVLRGVVYEGSQYPANLGNTVINEYINYGKKLGKSLHEMGYKGIAGIDSIITDEGIIPVVEINGRLVVSTYTSILAQTIGEVKTKVKYFNVVSSNSLNYKYLCEILSEEGLLYDKSKKEGIILCTSGTLPQKKFYDSSKYIGRIIAFIVSDSWDTVESHSCALDKLILYCSKEDLGDEIKTVEN